FSENGGVSGLLSRFQNAGLGDTAQSWVSTGANQPITSEHIQQVFSGQELTDWAGKLGIPPEMISTLLAQVPPQVVDHCTPKGEWRRTEARVQEAGEAEAPGLMGLLGRFLGR